MNILFLDQFSDLGGAQRCLLELLPAVAGRGWKAHLAAPGEGALREQALGLGATYRSIRCGPFQSGGKSISDALRFVRETPRLAREIAKLAAGCEAEIVYVNGPRLLPAASLGKPRGVPLVFHCHNHLGQGYAVALAGLSLAGANATVIANCRFAAAPLAPYVKAEIVYNGVAIREGRRAAIRTVRRIGMLGRIGPEKGQLEFVQAARLLPPEYEFAICGAPLFSNRTAVDYYERVRAAAAGLPIAFPGWRDDATAALSSLDLLVVPSAAQEATTRVILEAWAAGVPVVASNAGGIPEIVSDGETGYLTPPGDPARLAARIREAAAHPAVLQRVAEAAARMARERYTLRRYQDRVMSILERVGSSART